MADIDNETLAALLLKRYECLRALVDQSRAKPELVDTLGRPRSTLDDIVRELERAELVEYEDGHWRPTHLGRSAYRVHSEYLGQLCSLSDASPVLKVLRPDSEVSWEFVDDAEVHEPPPGVLDGVMRTLLDYVEAATDVRVVTPYVIAGYGDRFRQRALSGSDATFEMIAPAEVYEWLRSTYPTAATAVLDDPNANGLCAPVPFSYGISIFDDHRAGITVFTEQGIAGLLVNDTDRALTWAEEQYELVRRNADPISRP